MPIYRVTANTTDIERTVYVAFEIFKLNHVVYDGTNRDVYVAAPNEEAAKKKGLWFIKQRIDLDKGDESCPT